jgi:hypothetical protein
MGTQFYTHMGRENPKRPSLLFIHRLHIRVTMYVTDIIEQGASKTI